MIQPGPLVSFGRIYFSGNTVVKFDRLIREFDFKVGDVWNRNKLYKTISTLKKTDVFKSVLIEPDFNSLGRNSGMVPIYVKLVDDDPALATFRIGYFLTNKNFLFKRASTPRIGGSLILNNPFHRLDRFVMSVDLS